MRYGCSASTQALQQSRFSPWRSGSGRIQRFSNCSMRLFFALCPCSLHSNWPASGRFMAGESAAQSRGKRIFPMLCGSRYSNSKRVSRESPPGVQKHLILGKVAKRTTYRVCGSAEVSSVLSGYGRSWVACSPRTTIIADVDFELWSSATPFGSGHLQVVRMRWEVNSPSMGIRLK